MLVPSLSGLSSAGKLASGEAMDATLPEDVVDIPLIRGNAGRRFVTPVERSAAIGLTAAMTTEARTVAARGCGIGKIRRVALAWRQCQLDGVRRPRSAEGGSRAWPFRAKRSG